jgi:hypothetical protein
VIGLLLPLIQLLEESLWHTPCSQLCPGKVAHNLLASGWTSRRKACCSFYVKLGLLQTRTRVAEMELVRWPGAARSTCEQDQSVCVILHISSWRYGRIVTLFWCINNDCNLCVWFCISRDMLVWLSLCSTIFCMIYLLTCKHEEEQADGGWLICLFWCNMCVCVWFCILRDILVWLPLCGTIFCMIYLLTCKHEEEQADRGWLIHVSFDVICVCDFSSQETCLCGYLYAVQFFYDLPTHLLSLKNKPMGAG